MVRNRDAGGKSEMMRVRGELHIAGEGRGGGDRNTQHPSKP